MALKIGEAPKGNKDYGRLDEGTHMARLVQVIDLGVQKTEYKGEEKEVPRVWLVFEFPTETIEINGEDKPRWQGREYTVSYGDKSNLGQLVKALDPEGNAKSLADLLGKACMVSIGSTGTGKAKITNVVPASKKIPVPELANDPVAFDMDNPDMDVFGSLPQWLKDKITSSVNYHKTKLAAVLEGGSKSVPAPSADVEYDDESPFGDDE